MKQMKSIILFIRTLLFYFILLIPISNAQHRQLQCKVVGISDGDTLTCLHQYKAIKVRLLYIDAPESAQAFGNRAKQTLAQLAFKKEVFIQSTGYDRYDRLLGVVYDEKGQDINLKMVEQGMAWAYSQTKPIYQAAEAQARMEKRGLWQDPHPMNPKAFRDKKRNENKRSNFSNNLLSPQTPTQKANHSTLGLNCQQKRSCKQIPDYPTALYYFHQCGWQELDGNQDGIPCNKLYRKAKQ
ncbi:hypothetical protein A4G19_06645 [Pasteurellaceae bacterium Macca]|nr:hypothetical protein [Pasteurellaceae bacterium Macca]